MSKHNLIKRSFTAALVIGGASFPTVAQARLDLNPRPAPVVSSPTKVVSAAALPQSTLSAQSGFQWSDAGIGAAGTVVLLGAGAGAASTIRRRRVHRTVTG